MTIRSVVMGLRGAAVTTQAGTTQLMFRNKRPPVAKDPRLTTATTVNFDLNVRRE